MRILMLAVPILLAATPARADNDATPKPVSAPVKEKKTCRREDVTGSIMPKTTCRTKAEWDAIDKQNEADTERYRNRSQAGNNGRN